MPSRGSSVLSHDSRTLKLDAREVLLEVALQALDALEPVAVEDVPLERRVARVLDLEALPALGVGRNGGRGQQRALLAQQQEVLLRRNTVW